MVNSLEIRGHFACLKYVNQHNISVIFLFVVIRGKQRPSGMNNLIFYGSLPMNLPILVPYWFWNVHCGEN
jgi:hypothetical protein